MNPMTPPFAANVVHLDGNAMVVLLGELDMDSAPDLARVLDELTESGPPELVLDLSDLGFIDSSGIAVLVTAQGRLQERGRHLRVRSSKPLLARVFAITNLSEYLNVEVGETAEFGVTEAD